MSLKDFLVIGVVGGGTIGCISLICKNGRYKDFFGFIWHNPGTTLVCLSALVGVCLISGRSLYQFFKNFTVTDKPTLLLEISQKSEL